MHHKIYWTPEMESAFIDLVAGQPRIWDPRNKDYIRRSARNEAFLEVGAELKQRWPEHAQLFTYENMSNKFAMLRSCFRREWKLAQKMRGSESEGNYVPKWEHYASLSFLEEVPVRGARNRSSGVTPMDISDQSDDSDATSPDTEELDCGERPSTSGPKFRLNLRPFLPEEGAGHARLKQYQSSDDSSSNEDFPSSASNHSFRDILPADHLSAADVQRKNALDLAFCRYLNTMLSPIPDCLHKELAKIKITETILKLKFPQA